MICGVLLASCQIKKEATANKPSFEIVDVTIPLNNAQKQLGLQKEHVLKVNRIPRTLIAEGDMQWTRPGFDWTEGFFLGSLWFLYDFSRNEEWKDAAEKLQKLFEDHKYETNNHDLSFIFNAAHGNGYRLTGNEDFKERTTDRTLSSIITQKQVKYGKRKQPRVMPMKVHGPDSMDIPKKRTFRK